MYIADLHIHSKYSRATSKECVPEYLDLWARRKGIDLIGTGDFTHPAWREELKEKLIPSEEGLYILRSDARISDPTVLGTKQTRFVVSGEISSIYKKNGRVRKVHNVILLPSLEDADTLSHKLEAIGNIHSDGRPILGLDSRDLLEITLESCPQAIFIPAHIWTPHFSLFGAFSGFDTIEECFEDLTPHIRALETGLSSDPPMNWRVSALDRYHLVSNSDAHSPAKLGREANIINAELSYPALKKALEGGTKEGFGGTIEFFPEEGKYHFDGHRGCGLCMTPAQCGEYDGKCPVCGKKLTIGVQHRVEELADRAEGFVLPNAAPFESLVPLPEVLAASTGFSAAGKKVAALYEELLYTIGSEFFILREAPLEEIGLTAGPCIREGIRRLRLGQVRRDPGYDGVYGVIHILERDEIESLSGQISLFGVESSINRQTKARSKPVPKKKPAETPQNETDTTAPKKSQDLLSGLNKEQREAVTLPSAGAAAIIAGPGTGKTKTLISRIAYLIEECGAKPRDITAVTFTNKAAKEMRERLTQQFSSKRAAAGVTVGTFHSICLQRLKQEKESVTLLDEYEALETADGIIKDLHIKISPREFLREVSNKKNGLAFQHPEFMEEAFDLYCTRIHEQGLMDFDDLLLDVLALCGDDKKNTRTHLLVDEFQDINSVQYQLIQAWSRHGKSLFVIGDPDQAIYGFRGSDAHCFERLHSDFPDLRVVRLTENYRCSPEILGCSLSVISQNPGDERALSANRPSQGKVCLCTSESDLSEAIFVAKEINRMVGGIDMLDAQTLAEPAEARLSRSFSDIAVLCRTHRQARLLEMCLRKESIPYIAAGRDDFLSDETVRGAAGFFRFLLKPNDLSALRTALKNIWKCPADLSNSFCSVLSDAREGSLSGVLDKFSNAGPLQPCIAQLTEFLPRVQKTKPRSLLEEFADKNNLAEHEPLMQFMNMAVFHKDMASFIQTLLLGEEIDIERSAGKNYPSDAVRLMTLHGSKGLEFPVVFLSGVKSGSIPLETQGRETDIEEERRLFFVGMTRAKDELFLMGSKQEPSVFLNGIPQELLHTAPVRERTQPKGVQLSLFD